MAPSTRLQSRPERRINYADTSDPKLEIDAQAPPESPDASHKTSPKRVTRVKAGAVVKPKKAGPNAPRKAPTPQKKVRPTKQECSLCATLKVTTRSFRAPDDACEHFQSICNLCVSHMLKTKVAERRLGGVELSCPFPKCDDSLDYTVLQSIVSKAAFEKYDNAVTNHTPSMEESHVACLSTACGLYFSAQDCKSSKRGKQLVVCPYCNHEICLQCQRPWKSHGKGSCDQAKKADEELCAKAVKDMGAKPCPSCGMNIQKNGGCDHVTCGKCHCNFCWVWVASSNIRSLFFHTVHASSSQHPRS